MSDAPEVIYRRVFEPFGEIVAESVGTEDQRRYLTGKRESEATRDATGAGLIDFGARWYDAEIGRFLGIDPIVQDPAIPASLNPYSYVWNDPVNLTDPNGRGVWETVISALGIVVGIILMLAQQYWLGAWFILQSGSFIAADYNQPYVALGLSIGAAVAGIGGSLALIRH